LPNQSQKSKAFVKDVLDNEIGGTGIQNLEAEETEYGERGLKIVIQ
jgi:hypothetical protein